LLDCLFEGDGVAAHEAGGDLEVFGGGEFAGFEDPAYAWGIDGEGFFHEDMDAFVDGVFEVQGAEGGWGGEEDDIIFIERVDGFFEAIEAGELAFRGGVDLLGEAFPELGVGGLDFTGEDIGEGPELGGALGGEGLAGGAGAAAATADEGYLDGVAFCGVAGLWGGGGEGGSGESCSGRFEEAAAGLAGRGGGFHKYLSFGLCCRICITSRVGKRVLGGISSVGGFYSGASPLTWNAGGFQ
jgi:hypothetical protein